MPENTESRFCGNCGRPIAAGTRFCPFCGAAGGPGGARAEEGDATGGVIPYKNASALIAYYLGVFSVIPCFPIGLAGLVLGIKGLGYAKQHPQARGRVHAWIGIIAGGLFGLLWTVLTAVFVIASLGK
jgi:hypothetical protein